FILFLIALIFRIIDIFVLRLDDRLGEIILSISLGFILVIVYLYLTGKSLSYIGLHKQNAAKAFFIEFSDPEALKSLLIDKVQKVPGISRTLTCLAA
ncbi:MAG: hypothetical protein H8E13_00265, partial [Actinobacteria bacterium]|nr:hypothetical protein [Actinomycetota bacterium]